MLLHLMNDPAFMRFIGDKNIKTQSSARVYIEKYMIPHQIKHGFSTFTIQRKKDFQLIGTCGLYKRTSRPGVDVGFGLLSEFQGFGYGEEAVSRLVQAGFNHFNLRLIESITSPENLAAQKLLLKLNFQFEGLTYFEDYKDLQFLYSKKQKYW
jgi:RimJ/RimL family protein N-acetyltransferase